jgi:outer membrane autotransporter protein
MKKSARIGLVLVVCMMASLLLISTSFAAGPYMSVQVGSTWVKDADFDYDEFFPLEAQFDTGFNVGVAGGHDFGMVRLEAELAYRENDFDKIEFPFFGRARASGDISATSLMFNGYYDLETGSPVTPYLGAGLGVANVSMNDVKVAGVKVVDDDDTVFAYQIGAGVAFALNEVMALDLGYRYFATADPEFTDRERDDFDFEYKSHNVSLGLRINF